MHSVTPCCRIYRIVLSLFSHEMLPVRNHQALYISLPPATSAICHRQPSLSTSCHLPPLPFVTCSLFYLLPATCHLCHMSPAALSLCFLPPAVSARCDLVIFRPMVLCIISGSRSIFICVGVENMLNMGPWNCLLSSLCVGALLSKGPFKSATIHHSASINLPTSQPTSFPNRLKISAGKSSTIAAYC